MVEPQAILNGLTAALLGLAVIWDIRTRRIPNWLTLAAALLGLALQTAASGWAGTQQALVGWLVGLGLLLVPCVLGWVGAGDAKLLAAVGAIQGPWLALTAGLYGVAAGGFLALAVAVVATRKASTVVRRATLPYGPALAMGTFVALALR